jgi:ABC-2 type transport system permease protein
VFAATGFLLPVVVALLCGDTVASEASWSSLRYLLTAPVSRSRLLRQKLVIALALSTFAILLLSVVTFIVGGLFFGWAPAQSPTGSTLTSGQTPVRLLIIVGYVIVTMLFVAALGFFVGVHTDAPLGAVGGTVMLVIVSTILDSITQLGSFRNFLPTHYQYAWTDAIEPSISWREMAHGVMSALIYACVLLAFAWRGFLRKDIVS